MGRKKEKRSKKPEAANGLEVAVNAKDIPLDAKQLKASIDSGKRDWGRWRYQSNALVLYAFPAQSAGAYEITLDRIDTAAKLGDWLLHLAEKTWVKTSDLGDLVRAVEDLISVGYLTFCRTVDA